MREFHKNKIAIYEYDEWKVIEKEFSEKTNQRSETIFSLGNGYLGIRGNLEEGYSGDPKTSLVGTYINGIYESEPIMYGEYHYGYPLWGQTMINVTDWRLISFWIDDEKFDMLKGSIKDYSRTLDMKNGKLIRELIWRSPKGKEVYVNIERFVSLSNKHLAAIRFMVKPLNFDGEITFVSELDGDVRNKNLREQALIVIDKWTDGKLGYIQQKTNRTEFTIGCSMYNDFYCKDKNIEYSLEKIKEDKKIGSKIVFKAERNQTYVLDKYVNFYTSRDVVENEIMNYAKEGVLKAKAIGYDNLYNEHREYLLRFWEDADIKIKGDIALQQGIRFNSFQLLQSVGRDGITNIGAKGLTGEGYEGHYFWDSEIYVLPFFLYSKPEISKALLMYRYNTLDKARERAREMRSKGALFPWRTINGEEASSYFPASTAQYHIDADITYAIYKYVEATDDIDFLINYGAEIVFETARMWADRGGYIPLRDNKFCINEVTGPDEYKPCVDNNCYTNYMARFNLNYGVYVAELLRAKYPQKYEELKEKINLKEEELVEWKNAADNMYLPYDERLGINPQDDSFLYKEPYDVDSIPVEETPLVTNWHQLNIMRYQICKQADVILLMFLLGNEFDIELKKRNYDFYEPKTTHDSSLSACVFSIIASEIGYKEQAYNYFMQTARMDLDDYNNNAHEGIHTACMAGTWASVVNGFAGMRVYESELHFNPYLPDRWESYEFKIKYKNRQINVKVEDNSVTYKLLYGDDIVIWHKGNKVKLSNMKEVTLR